MDKTLIILDKEQLQKQEQINDFLTNLLILIIAKNIGIDSKENITMSIPWVKNLVEKITPLYKQLIQDQNINSNEMILEMVKVMNKHTISKDLQDVIDLNSGIIDVEHISEITKLSMDIVSLFEEMSKINITLKEALTQNNVITLLTIVLYVILFFAKKENFSDKDIKWIEVTLSCLKFTTTLVVNLNKKVNFLNLFACKCY